MEVLIYSGIPGSGKTLDATFEALKHYKKENNKWKYFIYWIFSKLGVKAAQDKIRYYNSFPYKKINNIYSSYPILLDKKKKIYSNKWSIFDFSNQWSFLPNAFFVDDEIQLKIDSEDYKDKDINKIISHIAKFMQSARHFGCSEIILCTQHPSRVFKKARNVASGFVQHKSMFMIPILKVGFLKTIKYFIVDDYGKFIPKSREERKKLSFEYKKKIKFMNFRKVFSSYDSRYLSKYNYNKPLLNRGNYTSMKVSYNDLIPYFEDNFKGKKA